MFIFGEKYNLPSHDDMNHCVRTASCDFTSDPRINVLTDNQLGT